MEVKTRVRARVSRARGVRVRGARESAPVVTPAVRVRFRALVITFGLTRTRPKIRFTAIGRSDARDEAIALTLTESNDEKIKKRRLTRAVGVVVTNVFLQEGYGTVVQGRHVRFIAHDTSPTTLFSAHCLTTDALL